MAVPEVQGDLVLSWCDVSVLDFTSQAFIEMNTEETANTMVNYYTTVTPVLRSQPIYIQFSNHKELKTDNSPNQAVSLFSALSSQGGQRHSQISAAGLRSRGLSNIWCFRVFVSNV